MLRITRGLREKVRYLFGCTSINPEVVVPFAHFSFPFLSLFFFFFAVLEFGSVMKEIKIFILTRMESWILLSVAAGVFVVVSVVVISGEKFASPMLSN